MDGSTYAVLAASGTQVALRCSMCGVLLLGSAVLLYLCL